MVAGKVAVTVGAALDRQASKHPSPIADRLVRKLDGSAIRYRLAAAPNSDILAIDIQPDDLGEVRKILGGLRAIQGVPARSSGRSDTGREDWFVPDISTAEYLHCRLSGSLRPEESRSGSDEHDGRYCMPCGAIVALIGPDGAGKSAQTAKLTEIFARKFRCEAAYLGSGEGGWAIRRAVKRRYLRWRSGRGGPAKGRDHADRPEASSRPLESAISGLAAAIERRLALRRARRSAASGMLVISDRWPQNLQPGIFDGPRMVSDRPSLLVRAITSVERRIFRSMEQHKPSLTIHLLIDFETSQRRKPGDRGRPDFEERLKLMEAMRERDPGIKTVDARQDFEMVTRRLFAWIWLACWIRGQAGDPS